MPSNMSRVENMLAEVIGKLCARTELMFQLDIPVAKILLLYCMQHQSVVNDSLCAYTLILLLIISALTFNSLRAF